MIELEQRTKVEKLECMNAEAMRGKKGCFLVNWSVTGKRGRKQSNVSEIEAHGDNPQKRTIPSAEERDMASFLVLLACSGNGNGSVENGTLMTEESVYQSKAKLMMPKHESDADSDYDYGSRMIINRKKMRKSNGIKFSIRPRPSRIRPVEDDESGTLWGDSYGAVGETNGKYRCNKCSKVFDSHQALGGHRASHRKVKGCFASARSDKIVGEKKQVHGEDEEEEITEEGNTKVICGYSERVGTKVKVHQCSVCHKVFLSGQALGGHKRCHWIEEKIPTDSSFISIDTHQGRTVKEELPDLNQPPPLAEEDLEAAYSITDEVFSSQYGEI